MSTTLANRSPMVLISLFVFLLCLYLFTASGHIESSDGNVMYGVTQGIVQSGNFHPNSPYGLTLSIVAIPFYLAGRLAAHVLHFAGDFPVKAMVSLTNAPITALTCLLVALIAVWLGIGRRAAGVLGLIYGTCTIAWPYAKTFFSEPLTALCLVTAFWAVLHVTLPSPSPQSSDRRSSPSIGGPAIAMDGRATRHESLWIAAAAIALGLGVLARETTIIVLPVFALYLIARLRAHPDRGRLLGVATATTVVCLAIVALWNVGRFGSPFATGYGGHLWTLSLLPGLFGLLISPYKGLLLFVPIVIVACLGWPRFYRRWPAEALLCGGVFLVYLIVHSAYTDWPAGGNWGPRLLVPALPFLFFGLPFAWTRSPRWTTATVILCLVGLLVQLPAVYVSYTRYYPLVNSRSDTQLISIADNDPARSPIVEQWRSVSVVTHQLLYGLPGASSELGQKLASTQPPSSMPLDQVLRQSATVNFPDFWFVYLALSGHLSRLLKIAVALLGLCVVVSGLVLGRALLDTTPTKALRQAPSARQT